MRGSFLLLSSLCLCVSVVHTPAADPGPWATYRGNSQRTGNTDGKPGPGGGIQDEKPAPVADIEADLPLPAGAALEEVLSSPRRSPGPGGSMPA